MKNNDSITLLLVLSILLVVGPACRSLVKGSATQNESNTSSAPANSSRPDPKSSEPVSENKTTVPGLEPPDFVVTAEQLDKEFTHEGVTDKDLEKYVNKNIRVSGRVSLLVTQKKGTVQPWVTLYAPGVLHGVNCYFDDEHVGEMSQLKMDKMVTVQGFRDHFIVPKIPASLKHCRVISGGR